MGIFGRIRPIVHDISMFGTGAVVRNFGRKVSSWVIGRRTFAVEIPGIGSIIVRLGDSDYETLVQTFGHLEYAVVRSVQNRIVTRYQQILNMRKVPVIIDAGANIGAAAIWFRSIYTESHIVAIEPDPGNLEILKRNVNAYPLITVVEAAVGSKSGFVSLVGNQKSWAVRTERADSGCQIVTIEQAINMVPNGVPFLVKIDIEGFERDLFAKNLEWVGHTFAIFIEPHDWMLPGEQSSRNFQRALGTGDFEIFINGENLIYVRTI